MSTPWHEGWLQYVALVALVCAIYAVPDAWKWAPTCGLLLVAFVLLPMSGPGRRRGNLREEKESRV